MELRKRIGDALGLNALDPKVREFNALQANLLSALTYSPQELQKHLQDMEFEEEAESVNLRDAARYGSLESGEGPLEGEVDSFDDAWDVPDYLGSE